MKKRYYIGLILVGLFILWTGLLLFVYLKKIGLLDSVVGFATVNKRFFNLTGVNYILYNITDFGGIPPILFGIFMGFVVLFIIVRQAMEN